MSVPGGAPSLAEVARFATPLSNWSKLFVHPFSTRLLWLLVRVRPVHPNLVTLLALALSVAAVPFYAAGTSAGFAAGAALWYLAFALDTIDGALARITGQTSKLGAWLDLLLDFVRSSLVTSALAIGVFRATGDVTALYVGLPLLAVILFHYHLGEVSSRVLQARNREVLERDAGRLTTALRRLGLVPNPLALNDVEALYLVVMPVAGHPLLGMQLALGLGALSRLAVLFLNARALLRGDAEK